MSDNKKEVTSIFTAAQQVAPIRNTMLSCLAGIARVSGVNPEAFSYWIVEQRIKLGRKSAVKREDRADYRGTRIL